MKNINEKFDIEEYCMICGLDNFEIYVNGAGHIFIIVYDGNEYSEYEIGNTGENAYCVKDGYRKASTIVSIKSEIKKISLDILSDMCYS